MFDKQKSLETIAFFKAHYHYDTTYMEEMLEASPQSYEVFENFLPMAIVSQESPPSSMKTAVHARSCMLIWLLKRD